MPKPDLPTALDVRLVVTDMDGTLLDEQGRVPGELWPLLERMRAAGVAFAPASGRQYATLQHLFAPASQGMPFIAENGTFVVQDDTEISSHPLDRPTVEALIPRLRAYAASGADMGTIACGKRSAYTERSDEAFLAEARRYYVRLEIVEDVLAVDDEFIKLALFDFGGSERGTAAEIADLRDTHQVVVSGERWVDVMALGIDKGVAVRDLQQRLGLAPAQTAVFGDFLNDLEMLDAADYSFAMANAHPKVLARARYLAPANTENGVIVALRRLLAL